MPVDGPSIHVFSDAWGSYGCGAFSPDGMWFNTRWPSNWATVDIAIKELVPLVLAAALWATRWRGHQVVFHVDNMAVVAVVQ